MAASAGLQAGTIVGTEYRVVRPLAEGGMGALYVAEQLSTGALRALKIMHPQFSASATFRKRFVQEARASARIDSAFVAQVLGAGFDDGLGVHWMAMELLQGEGLDVRIDGAGAMSVSQMFDVMRPLCHALGAAHAAGIVHRDLKPQNIFLSKPRGFGDTFVVKVLDFGIAKVTAEAQTHATQALGTPLWMAPEQTSLSASIGPEADVWALGLIAFYVLTGHRFWLAAHNEYATLAALLREVTLDPIEPASVRATAYGASLPSGFDTWLACCLDRTPSERFHDARQAYDALIATLGTGPSLSITGPVVAPASVSTVVEPAAFGEATKAVGSPPNPFADPPGLPGPWPFVSPATQQEMEQDAPRVQLPPARHEVTATATARDMGAAPRILGLKAAAAVGGVAVIVAMAWWRPWQARSGPVPTVAAVASVASSPAPSLESVPDPSVSIEARAREVGHRTPMKTFAGVEFTMGSALGAHDELPLTKVTLAAFLMDTHETTASDYKQCVDVAVCSAAGTGDFCTGDDPSRLDHPINCVSWTQAQTYCGWLGRRLPTEAEWEYAAAGRAGRQFPWGSSFISDKNLCWGRCKTNAGTCKVGSYPAGHTPEGIEDLAGNVWEWTASSYCSYGSALCNDPRHVVRGGGWCGADGAVVRAAVRLAKTPATQSANIGFRCVRSL
ncbi:MAG: bifunctional serine/threonine-protein kinase/formylglycine-generating enzyme family protein [Myxococcales bacterium]